MIESSLILCPVRNPLKPDRPDLSPPTYSQKTGSSALVKQIKKQTQGKNLVWTDPKVSDIINNDYVLITLYVDNKNPLTSPVKITENGTERTLRTVGDKWSYLQRVKFGANAQPFYVLINNEGEPLNKSYSYDESIPKYIEFLQTGLENYKKER